MFDLIKQQVSLIELLEKDLSVTFRQSGDKNWIIDGDKDQESCPFCSHHDCFKVHHVEGDNSGSFYKCFSCGAFGDVITWKAKESKLKNGEAARALAKEYDIKLPHDYSPIQQVFNLAGDYYHNCLIETCNKAYPVLNGLTPLRYQTEVRKHKLDTLSKYKIGYSDGGLVSYLDSLGIDKEVLEASGLMGKTGKDFLPSHCFIYPHFVRGRVSHFTFKDPTKRIQYQLPKKFSLNGYIFYGQDVGMSTSVTSLALVEGENDFLSVVENGGGNTMAIIGQISGEQLDWLRINCKDKQILTMFDPDDAGDKYREKVELLRRHFKGLVHIRPGDGKDIDEHLAGGASLADIVKRDQVKVVIKPPERKAGEVMPWEDAIRNSLENPTSTSPVMAIAVANPAAAPVISTVNLVEPGNEDKVEHLGFGTLVGPVTSAYVPPVISSGQGGEVVQEGSESEPEVIQIEDSSVIQMRNCYYKVTYKDGIPTYNRISDFTLVLKDIILDEETNERTRELIVRRQDGYRSCVFTLDSGVKVNNAKFKEKMAQVADAEWMGRENDLDSMWRLVYSQFPEIYIRLLKYVGRHTKYKCWAFNNLLITENGVDITPDENGVFWVSGKSNGLKIKDIYDEGDRVGVPSIRYDLTREETDEILAGIIKHMQANFQALGPVLMALGWVYSNIYSNEIFKADGGFGSMMFWGSHGQGKSTVAYWLQAFFGFKNKMASTSIPQLKTGIGFMREASFYGSLPLMLDEVKMDEETGKKLGLIRGWYDRTARVIAQKDSTAVKIQEIRACLLMAGEDLPADPATKERIIMLRIPKTDTKSPDMKASYEFMNNNMESFSNIMYYWIKDSTTQDKKEVLAGIRELDRALVKAGCSNRTSKVWSGAGYFASKIAEKHCPGFDFVDYIAKTASQEQQKQYDYNVLSNFYSSIATLRVRENSRITDRHIFRSGKYLHIWFSAVFDEVREQIKANPDNKWSKLSVLSAIREEPYFVSDSKKINMGLNAVRTVVLTLDLTKCPEILKEMVEFEDEVEIPEVKEVKSNEVKH